MAKLTPSDIAAWLTLLPVLIQLIDYVVSVVERLFPMKPGPEKKSTAMKIVNSLVPTDEDGTLLPQGYISKLIDNQVALNNQAGKFHTSTPGKLFRDPESIYGN